MKIDKYYKIIKYWCTYVISEYFWVVLQCIQWINGKESRKEFNTIKKDKCFEDYFSTFITVCACKSFCDWDTSTLTISETHMTQRMVQRTTVRKDLKDSSWGVGVQTDVRCSSGARWERVLWAAGSPTTGSPNRRADESGTRNGTPELSSCPSLTLPFPYLFAVSSCLFLPPRQPAPIESHWVLQLWIPSEDCTRQGRMALH